MLADATRWGGGVGRGQRAGWQRRAGGRRSAGAGGGPPLVSGWVGWRPRRRRGRRSGRRQGDQLVVGAELDEAGRGRRRRSGRPAGPSTGGGRRRSRCGPRISRSMAPLDRRPRCPGRGWTSPRRARAPPGRRARRGPATPAGARPPTAASPARGPRCRARRGRPAKRSQAPIGRDRGVDLGVGRARPRQADVVADRAAEQEALLRHDDDALAQRGHRGVRAGRRRRSATVPAGRVVEPGDQLGQRRLAGAGRADQRQPLAGGDRSASTSLQHRSRAAGVGERHAVDLERRRRPAGRPRRALGDVGLGVEQAVQLVQRRARRLHAC